MLMNQDTVGTTVVRGPDGVLYQVGGGACAPVHVDAEASAAAFAPTAPATLGDHAAGRWFISPNEDVAQHAAQDEAAGRWFISPTEGNAPQVGAA